MQSHNQIVIQSDIRSVWQRLINPENMLQWIKELQSVSISDNDFTSTGVKANITAGARGRTETGTLTFSEVDAPHTLTLVINSDNIYARMKISLSKQDKATNMEAYLDFELEGLAARFVSLSQSMVDQQLISYSSRFKAFAEK